MSTKNISYIIIFLIAGIIGCYLRLYPLRHYVSSDAYDKASVIVMNNAINAIKKNINKTNPSLSSSKQQQLAITYLNSELGQNKNEARKAIMAVAKGLDKKDPPLTPFPYLLASDSYYYYDLTKTLEKTGRLSPKINGSKYFHPKMIAPDGYWEPLNLHAYVGLAIHSVISLIKPETALMFSVSFTPLILMLLALAFFIMTMKNLNISSWSTLIASVYFVCAQIFLKRSTFGWYDNDPYNVLFPTLLLMILTYAFQTKTRRAKIIAGVIIASALSLYSLFWQGWVFVATVLATSLVIIAIYDHLVHDHIDEKNTYITLSTFLIGSLLGISLIFGIKEIAVLFQEGWQALLGFFNAKISVWPDTYIAVGELKRSSLRDIIALTGGFFFIAVAAIGLIEGFYHVARRLKNYPHRMWIVASVFSLAAIMISVGAQRFTILSIAPLTLLFALGLNIIDRHFFSKWPLHQKIAPIIIIICACIIPKVIAAEKNIPQLLNPIYNDTWNKSLTYINNNTPEDAIINSWWPPGHFIKAVADRRVTIDGATITNHQSYWLANALLARTESEALNYFRLLNNSGNKATDLLLKSGMKDSEAVAFLKNIIQLPKTDALLKASTVLEKNAKDLILLTHTNPDTSYLLVYNEMVNNLLLFPFITRWNFKRVEQINENPQQLTHKTTQEYVEFLWNLVGGHPKISGIFSSSAQQGPLIFFGENLIINMMDKTCLIKSSKYGSGIPAFLFYQDGERVVKKPLANATLPYSIVVGKRPHEKYQAMLLETPLAESLLVRLYFFGNTGLDHIKRIHQETSLTQQTQIDIFKIKYNLAF